MKRPAVLITLSTLALAPLASAQDGKVMYEQLCGACHGNDGQGAQEGQFPPLADSAWIKGAPDRMIQVVLHGMMGEVTVPSKFAASPTYNLVMPPQGAALTSDQIARITTYVRTSWGNKEGAITVAMVEAQRKATDGKTDFWQANELLERYPLSASVKVPDENTLPVDVPIRDLLSYVYTGSWDKLPDWGKLKAQAVEEEHKGLIASSQAGKSQDFGLVWEGKVIAPKSGTFTFRIDSDDGSRVIVGGKNVAEINSNGGMGRATEGNISLKQGEHPIRIEYYNKGGPHGITLGMKGPGLKGWFALSEAGAGNAGSGGGKKMPIYPLTNEAVIYRNFIEGTTPRGIGVGYHGGVNLAFSADNMSLDLLWTGNFMDGSKHWNGRGQGNQPPAGQNVVKVSKGPSFAILKSQTTNWPDKFQDEMVGRFHGYKLNSRQEPTFFFTIGKIQVEDMPQAIIGGNKFGLQRAITITVLDSAPSNVHFLAASGLAVKDLGGGKFDLGGQAVLEVGKGAANRPYVRNNNELLIPLRLKRGENILNLRYTWN
ncbi:MAG: PA14 domain-containing protein [Roseibacillus sp.]